VGAVGGAIAEQLVRAGVGRITIIDRDFVDFSNLTRQTLYTWTDAEKVMPKAEAARRHLNEIIPSCQVFPRIVDLNPDNIHFMLKGAHVIADGTDNMETRYLINDWCITERVPWVYSGAVGVEASTFPILGKNKCFRCIFPEPPPPGTLPTCDTAGVLGSATSVAASHASTLIIRILLGDYPEPILRTWNVWDGTQASITSEKMLAANSDKRCPLCDDGQTEFLDSDASDASRAICGRDMVQVAMGGTINLNELEKSLSEKFEVTNNGHLIRFIVNGYKIYIFEDGRAMVEGTRELEA